MRRRVALAGLLGTACCVLAAPAGRHEPSASPGVLAWGPAGAWVGDERGGALQALPGPGEGVAALVAALPVAGGMWAAAGSGRVARWRRDGDGLWAVAAQRDFDAPVHALAASGDGRFALAAHGEQLSLLGADGLVVRRYDGIDLARRQRGRATNLFHLPQRRSFVVAWAGLDECWEILLDPAAEPIYDGLVHDYRMGEAIATAGYLGVRRIPLGRPMPGLGFADARVAWVAGLQDEQVQVIQLDVRRRIAQWPLPGAALQAALLRREGDAWVWWLPAGHDLQRFDTDRWQPLGRESLPGKVLALQGVGDGVWALTAQHGVNTLSARRGGVWTPVPLPMGQPQAMHADASGRRVLVALAEPPRLLMLDDSGLPMREWSLPAGAAVRAVRWLPFGT